LPQSRRSPFSAHKRALQPLVYAGIFLALRFEPFEKRHEDPAFLAPVLDDQGENGQGFIDHVDGGVVH